MNLMRGLLTSIRRRHGAIPEDDRETSRIGRILDRRSAIAGETDPETGRMWRKLAAGLENAPARVPRRPLHVRFLKPALAFALLAIAVVAGEMWTGRPVGTTYSTSRGENATIHLPDSSVVTLNHTSALTLDPGKNGTARRVTLKGEAFFRVRKNGTPFVVSTALGSVRVLGTEFNVLVRDDRLEVAVLGGSVRVTAERDGKDSSVVLSAGEIVVCTGGGYPETPVPIQFAGYPGWMHGRFIFYRTSLPAACREIESQFGVVVDLGNPRLKGETITGEVDCASVGSSLSALSRLTGTRYRYENGVYIVY